MIQFKVYIRQACHLCDELLTQLRQLNNEYSFEFQLIDVDSRPEYIKQHGAKVPVVMLGDREICHYFLDHASLIEVLQPSPTQ